MTETATPVCPECSGRKFVIREKPDGGTHAVACVCRPGANPAARVKAAGVSEEELRRALLPLDPQVGDKTRKVLALYDGDPPHGSLLVTGDVGRGKSVLAVRVMLRVAEKHPRRRLAYAYVGRLLLEVSATMNRRSEADQTQVLDPLLTADLLVLDDLGIEHLSQWTRSIIAAAVHERWRQRQDTVITTKLPPEVPEGAGEGAAPGIRELYGDDVYSRLRDYRWVTMAGDDLRERYRGGQR